MNQTAQTFITAFLTRTQRAHAERKQRSAKDIPAFSSSEIPQLYRASKRRLILLAIENTLVVQDPKVMRDKGYEIPGDVAKLLTALTADERNVVYLLSGLPVDGALEKIAELFPKAGFM